MKGVTHFGVKGKLAPQYIGPYQILERYGKVAYRLRLPEHLAAVHDVFHVSQLKKCLRVPEQNVEVEGVELEPDLTYSEYPIRVWMRKIMLLEDIQSSSTRYNGINIQKKKLRGSLKIIC